MQCLTPLSSKIPKYKIYGFDIETVGKKNKFLMGSIVGDNDYKVVFWDQLEMCEFIAKKRDFYYNARLFATNLQFDTLALYENTPYIENFEPLLRNSSFICAKYRHDPEKSKRYVTFLDTLRFAPFSVKQMGKILGMPKLKTPDYILEERAPRKSEYKEVEEYNLMDSKITQRFAAWLQHNFNDLGAKMKMTIASTSLDLFKRQYLKNRIYQEPIHVLKKLYEGYYGGRTEAIKRGHCSNLNYYDFNSLYPSVMMNKYPDVNTSKRMKKGNMDIIETYDGISQVTVTAPKMHFPLLPCRDPKSKKLTFPIGKFSGWYTNFELRKAMQHGYDVKKIKEQVYYTRNHEPFKDYVASLWEKRLQLKKDKKIEQIIPKLNMNSLYGKFAQKIYGEERILHINSVTHEMLIKLMKKCKVTVQGNYVYIVEETPRYIPCHVLPMYSIYTTAYARMALWKIANCCDPYYLDTDSIVTKGTLPSGDGLGELECEYKIKEGIFVKPKMYAFIDDMGESHVRVKGLPVSRAWSFSRFDEFLKNPRVEYKKFVKFKEANRRNLSYNEIIDTHKEMTLEDDKRCWHKKWDGELQSSEPLKL